MISSNQARAHCKNSVHEIGDPAPLKFVTGDRESPRGFQRNRRENDLTSLTFFYFVGTVLLDLETVVTVDRNSYVESLEVGDGIGFHFVPGAKALYAKPFVPLIDHAYSGRV